MVVAENAILENTGRSRMNMEEVLQNLNTNPSPLQTQICQLSPRQEILSVISPPGI